MIFFSSVSSLSDTKTSFPQAQLLIHGEGGLGAWDRHTATHQTGHEVLGASYTKDRHQALIEVMQCSRGVP